MATGGDVVELRDDQLVSEITHFDGLPMPGGILDHDGTIVAVNRVGCQLLARPADQLVGRKAWSFAPGIEHVWTELIRFAVERGEQSGELAIATPTGARTIRYVLSAREAGGRRFMLAFAVDVTRPDGPG